MRPVCGRAMPDDFEQMWATIAPARPLRAPVAATSASRGPPPEAELRAWFTEQCVARGLVGRGRRQRQPARPTGGAHAASAHPDHDAVLIGSHLDSVLDGGAYDGPLGVVSSLAAIDLLRERGVTPAPAGGRRCLRRRGGLALRPGLPGLAAGHGRDHARGPPPSCATPTGDVPARRDGRGRLRARARAGRLGRRIGCFVELHVEQGRDLVDRDAAVGLASEIWPHGRYRFDFTGEANHAGTTRMEDRHDPMLSYAMTALAAAKQARLAGQRATFGRLDVAPNGTNAIPSRVTAWLDARCDSEESLAALVAEIERLGTERAGRDGTSLAVTPESVSGAVELRPGAHRAASTRPSAAASR